MFSWFSTPPPSRIKNCDPDSEVHLNVNGETHKVPIDLAANIVLCDYLRDHLHLTGTKFMCREGTCGSCVVSVKRFNHVHKEYRTISINSCLLPVYACSGFDIWTNEGIGNRDIGYHKIQEQLARGNGSQCGYCSSGMVMTMYSFFENEKNPAVQDVEDLFDGNLCRCTGYRPILDVAKSFSSLQQIKTTCAAEERKCIDGSMNGKWEMISRRPPPIRKSIHVELEDADWHRPMTLDELYAVLRNVGEAEKYRLVCGNTSTGIFPEDGPYDIYIDTKGIQEFYQCDLSDNSCIIGANICLDDFITILQRMERHLAGYTYCGDIAQHVKLVATKHVRNIGCWAGNIMTKKNHPDFPSDIFTMLEAAHATINLGHFDGSQKSLSPLELLSFDTKGWVVLNLKMQPLSSDSFFRSYKIMPRSQSSQAYVNCAFLIEVNKDDNFTVLSTPSIVYAGISSTFVHAEKTENYLTGKQLNDAQVLENLLDKLYQEITPDPERLVGRPEYRKQLAINLYYKFLLELLRDFVSLQLISGGAPLIRPISSGIRIFDTDKSEWPLTKPMSKLESLFQCAGEAEYIIDIPKPPHIHYAAFVKSTVGNAYVKDVDPSEALNMPGVVKFITFKDIPGVNNIYPVESAPEELLSSGRIFYAGQPIALIIAKRQAIADAAVKVVKVTYDDQQPLVLTLDQAMKNLPPPLEGDKNATVRIGDAEAALKTATNVVQGEVQIGTQYNIHMETQVCLCIPTEDGMDVFTSTQWIDLSQQAIAELLNCQRNYFNLKVRRLGGAYGGKISRNLFAATGCALAAHLIKRPVLLHMDLPTNLELVGKRNPVLANYEVGFDNNGKLQAVKIEYFVDYGCNTNETVVGEITRFGQNGYDCPNWLLVPRSVPTNTASNTYVRAPGSVKGVFVTEVMMENVAKYLRKNPWDVKTSNLKPPSKDGLSLRSNLQDVCAQLIHDANVDERVKNIEEFNKNNRWKKKGLSVVPMEYPLEYGAAKFTAMVTIYRAGGTVAVTHGGIEVGQGINTKIAQVCAHELGIPLNYVSVKPTNNFTSPNADTTGGSITSELNCKAVMGCCAILLDRMKPVREKLKNPSWEELVDACYSENVNLCTTYMLSPKDKVKTYKIYGCTCTEVEIDVLTGQHEILRVDILFDCGISMNPTLDIGQVEGAFVMGIGFYLLEEVKYDSLTGRNLTNRLWTYFPPASKDIPVDFRITLLKNAPNPFGVLRSKAVGEPPLLMSCSVLFAIQAAIHSVRADQGFDQWVPLNAPATAESILLASKIKKEYLVYKITEK